MNSKSLFPPFNRYFSDMIPLTAVTPFLILFFYEFAIAFCRLFVVLMGRIASYSFFD